MRLMIVILALIMGCLVGYFLARKKAEYQAARRRVWDKLPDDVKDDLCLKHLPIAVGRLRARTEELVEKVKALGVQVPHETDTSCRP